MNGKQFAKGLAIIGGLLGYSYALHKISFWGGRVIGWCDAVKVVVEAAKEIDKENKKTEESE